MTATKGQLTATKCFLTATKWPLTATKLANRAIKKMKMHNITNNKECLFSLPTKKAAPEDSFYLFP